MGNTGTKMGNVIGLTSGAVYLSHAGLLSLVLEIVLKSVIRSFMAPPKRENTTVQAIRAKWKAWTQTNAESLPTEEEMEAAFKKHKYRKDRLHFAICGPAGSGKSSLINTFRGLKAKDLGAAPVGIVETTTKTTRYPDTRPGMPYELFVWYDIPGAGTVDTPSLQYFNEQGLFIFDFIVLVYDNRFTEIDAKILEACQKFSIPSFVVRSKANQHISNMCLHDDDLTYETARDQYVSQTRQNFEENLTKLDLYDEKSRCYIVSDTNMYRLIKSAESGEPRGNAKDIDEEQLLADLIKAAFDRRYKEGLSRE